MVGGLIVGLFLLIVLNVGVGGSSVAGMDGVGGGCVSSCWNSRIYICDCGT